MDETDWPQFDGRRLQDLVDPSFVPKAARLPTPPLGYVMTTERCELSCVMCHFNGPRAARRGVVTLDPAIVVDILRSRPKGDKFWFVATGEFLSDPNALFYIKTASELGILPSVITHGQLLTPDFIDKLLEAGLKQILVSVDSIDATQYARIRRGGNLMTILDAFAYLRRKRWNGADIKFGVSAICFAKNKHSKQEVIDYWSTKVDFLQFVSEYHDVFHLRRLFFVPERRTDCRLEIVPLPSGRAAPCCAVAVYSHDHDVSWLPDLAEVDVTTAYHQLCDMYEDPTSPLAALCTKCDWWTQFHTDADGNTPIYQMIRFDAPVPV
jgi:MoaA/NifB/PqqE/SkfB family radical SAM enzyme